jgi:hypothetical protein
MSAVRRFVGLVIVGLICSTGLMGFASQKAGADFTVMWAMDLPRQTYFIGETVTFTVTAFASTDPTLKIPGELAQITIRNESLQEMYSAWITTDSNGSAPINWDIPITADPGNYTVILTDTHGFTSHQSIEILYNEETYWKTRVDLLQKEIEKQYQYINYLFSYNKWLTGQVNFMRKNFTLMWIIAFLAMLSGLYNFMYVSSRSKRNTSGILSYTSRAAEVLGFRSRPSVELDHEEIMGIEIPEKKKPPVYGHIYFCPVCDVNKLHPMTEVRLREHLWAEHDRLHLKKDSIMAKWRARKKKGLAKAEKKANELPKPAFASVEKYQEEWAEEKTKEQFKARLNFIKRQVKKKKISKAEAQVKMTQLRADMQKVKETMSEPVVLKQTPSPKPEIQRKARTERQLSSPPKVPAGIPTQKTAIDELFERLNHEKVN